MFLKRLFLFAALIIGACGGAWGEVDPRPTGVCVAGTLGTDNLPKGKTEGIYNSSTGQGINAHYIVYFDNDESDVSKECEGKVSDMASNIKKIEKQLDGILLFATADKTGAKENNVNLAQDRLTVVKNALSTAGVVSGLYDCTSDTDGPCASFAAGDQPWKSGSQFQGRAVYIFLIYKDVGIGTLCGEKMKDALTALETKLSAYGNDSDVKQKLKAVSEFCSGDNGVAATDEQIKDFEKKWKDLIEALPSELKNEVSDTDLQLKIAKVQLLHNKLSTGGSVWKNKDGKFNSYRLMADSVGTVVLGTAGALLSSHLIKKAQVKEGFEDLQCTIGGQLVANWGDEFRPTVQFVQ